MDGDRIFSKGMLYLLLGFCVMILIGIAIFGGFINAAGELWGYGPGIVLILMMYYAAIGAFVLIATGINNR